MLHRDGVEVNFKSIERDRAFPEYIRPKFNEGPDSKDIDRFIAVNLENDYLSSLTSLRRYSDLHLRAISPAASIFSEELMIVPCETALLTRGQILHRAKLWSISKASRCMAAQSNSQDTFSGI
jgi:hypothetical protein